MDHFQVFVPESCSKVYLLPGLDQTSQRAEIIRDLGSHRRFMALRWEYQDLFRLRTCSYHRHVLATLRFPQWIYHQSYQS